MSSSQNTGLGVGRGSGALRDWWGRGATQMEDEWADTTVFLQAETTSLVRSLGPAGGGGGGQSRELRLWVLKPGLAVG